VQAYSTAPAGEKFLADGILPTTNEISILKYLDPEAPDGDEAGQPLVQERDGLFVRRLPADLLKEMNIVDTPGESRGEGGRGWVEEPADTLATCAAGE
jgi:hypothetical protein